MKNLLFNLNSVEESYGESILTSVIQINERIDEIAASLHESPPSNDFLIEEFSGRIEKLRELNRKIREELHQQEEKLRSIEESFTVHR
jgi:hypothetical protein